MFIVCSCFWVDCLVFIARAAVDYYTVPHPDTKGEAYKNYSFFSFFWNKGFGCFD